MVPFLPEMSAQDVMTGAGESSTKDLEHEAEDVPCTSREGPDYLARQRAPFGNRVLPDSQVILDEMRADRW